MKPTLAIALCAALSLGWAQAASAAPKLKPSIEGMWAANFVMSIEAPAKDAPPLVVPEGEAKAVGRAQAQAVKNMFGPLDPEVPYLMDGVDGLPLVRGERHSRLVVQPADGRLPYTPEVRKAFENFRGPPQVYDNPEQRPSGERCLTGVGQAPITTLAFASNLQILRLKDVVVIHTEYGDEVRVIPIADKHQPKVLWGRLGDSIARWDGGTLVVETVGLPDADRLRLGPTFVVPGEATVIERFTAVSDRELLYQFTVIDPKTYAAPWLAEFSWYRTDKPMYEHACHEGNYSLPNILAGARHLEAEKAAAAAGGR
ncbi:MAG: hypothetical protein JSR98_07295 [Proteobacteria bacterium]|nr:hypothetical protein [Pseudomonadota bacterium]